MEVFGTGSEESDQGDPLLPVEGTTHVSPEIPRVWSRTSTVRSKEVHI